MSNPPIKLGVALLAALSLGLGACSDSSAPSSNLNALSAGEAQSLGADVAQDMDDIAEFSSFNGSTGVEFSLSSSGARINTPPPGCATITPQPPVNSDSDLVPDSVRFAYNDCVFTRANGAIIDSLSGTVDFLDPLPNQNSIGVKHIFSDLRRSRTNTLLPARSFSAVHDGTREWGASVDTLGQTISNFVTVRTFAGGRSHTHTKNWVSTFTATTPGSIALGLPLPAGSWTLDGTGSWTNGTRTWTESIVTTTPLLYDPSCTASPRFTAGRLDLVMTRNTETTNVQIDFIGCGQVLITRTVGGTA
jgi:hypothetical protein